MCFSLGWIEQLLVYCVCVIAVVAIIRLLVPYILSMLGGGGAVISAIINIVLWAVVAIFVIYIAFGLISCLLGAGHHLSLLR